MAERIPQSTTIRVPLQAYLSADHVSPATGKTIVITLSKNGAAYGNPSGGATNAVEIGSGSYYVDLSTTDTGTAGPVFVLGTSSGVDNVVAIYDVANANNAGFLGVPNAVAGASGGIQINGSNAGAVAYTGGMTISSTTGDALALSSTGGNGSGINASGNGSGRGIVGTGGVTGYGILGMGGATSGSGIRAQGQGTTAQGFHALGSGSGAGVESDGGATGPGLKLVGGATSGDGLDIVTTVGDGISILPTSGNGIVATANGTSKHGAVITGGTAGTSDGMKLVAGVGGVDLRANQTGNLVGTVSTLTTYTGNTPQTGDAFARLGAPAGSSVSADIAAVKSDTGTILTDVNTGAGAIYTRLGAPAGASIAADIASVKTSVGSVTNPVTVSLTQTLNAARALDAIADTSLTLNDALQCAIGVYAGKWSITGTSWVCKTPSTGTTIRTFTLDSGTAPTSRT